MKSIERRKTRRIYYDDVPVGGDSPITVQSMLTVAARNVDEAIGEIESLVEVGCEIVRVAVQNSEDAKAIEKIADISPIPVIADIHFDYRLAVEAAEHGAAGLRINPGNIGGEEKVRRVIEAAKKGNIAIRIGVNSGSVEEEFARVYEADPARALFLSAEKYIGMMERMDFEDIVVSLKSSDPTVTIEANRMFSSAYEYPLHIGVTEAGPALSGAARSVVALTILLIEGIGDTVRISLSGDPVNEVIVARAMLSSMGLRDDIPQIVSCPTCGRSWIDVQAIAEKLERRLMGLKKSIKVAVMGCEVNGPGEAKEADIGIAGTRGGAVVFEQGRVLKTITGDIVESFAEEVAKFVGEK
ncbi:4-hydroxy-3-methylbut-2-en-1-yl diphosphate synthase [bacterium]|nr:MAG: 4-hydroxy-3-methylbut-2-en-1-yl diphosphate synthase [bacterium]